MKNPFRIDHLFLRLLLGRNWKQKLWISKRDRDELLGQVLIAQAPVLTRSNQLHVHKIATIEQGNSVNPSLLKTPSGYLLLARLSKLRCYDGFIHEDNPEVTKTANYLYELDQNFSVLSCTEVEESYLQSSSIQFKHDALSDTRLFHWKNAIWGIGAGKIIDDQGEKTIQILARFDGAKITKVVPLLSPFDAPLEKNWSPLVIEDELFLVYSYRPLIIFKMVGDTLELFKQSFLSSEPHTLRGGSPLVPWGDHYLGVVHSSPLHLGKRVYTHSFVLLDQQLNLLRVSDAFFIQHIGVEFVAGIAVNSDHLVLSYGVADQNAWVCKVPFDVVRLFVAS